MSDKSYLEIRRYQANKPHAPVPMIKKDLFNRGLIDCYESCLSRVQLKNFSDDRGIPIDTLRKHRIGWDGYAYTLPIFHENGFLIGFRRKIPEGDTISKKGSRAGLFNVECLKTAPYGAVVYICEGEWDTMSMEAHGYEFVVGVPGALTFLKEWVHLFKGKHVVLLYDADQTGRECSKKVAQMLCDIALSVKNVDLAKVLSHGKDVRDYFNGK